MTETPDKKAIACNFLVGTSSCPVGGLAYLRYSNRGEGCARVQVLAKSRGGRWVIRYTPIDRLHNFRFKTIPPSHPRYADPEFQACAAQAAAQIARGWPADDFNLIADRVRAEQEKV